MAKGKGSFKEFLSAIAPEHQVFVEKLNTELIEQGCDLVIKEAKSGYTASYLSLIHISSLVGII